jgi:hypothetical protein
VEGASPEKLVRTFLERDVIAAKPYEIMDAVHAFAAKPGHTAFGFPLVAVTAWQQNSEFFGRGPGTAPPVHFAFVVRANTWQLARAVRQTGIKTVRQGWLEPYPQVHVVGFNSENQDTLPPGADPRFAYAQVICSPRL